jgi:hypothetical protein
MMREEVVPGELAVDANRHPIAFVGADEAIQRIDIAFRKVGFDFFEQCVKDRCVDRTIRITPIDVLLTRRFFDEGFVLGRTAGVWTRIDNQLSVAAQYAFTTPQRMLDQLGRRKVLPEVSGFEFFRNGKNDRVSLLAFVGADYQNLLFELL